MAFRVGAGHLATTAPDFFVYQGLSVDICILTEISDKCITQHSTVGVCILIEIFAFFTEKVSTYSEQIEVTFAFYQFVIISIIITIII